MKYRTIRELGGEVFAEIRASQRDVDHPLANMDWRLTQDVIDIVMGVLARHTGEIIVNDEDFPVVPLPRTHVE